MQGARDLITGLRQLENHLLLLAVVEGATACSPAACQALRSCEPQRCAEQSQAGNLRREQGGKGMSVPFRSVHDSSHFAGLSSAHGSPIQTSVMAYDSSGRRNCIRLQSSRTIDSIQTYPVVRPPG